MMHAIPPGEGGGWGKCYYRGDDSFSNLFEVVSTVVVDLPASYYCLAAA